MRKERGAGRQRAAGKAVAAVLVVTGGLLLILYPFLADFLYAHRTEGVIAAIDEASSGGADAGWEEALRQADAYNLRLCEKCLSQIRDPVTASESRRAQEEYQSLLRYDDSGIMGYISIPCIRVNLPVYHGASGKELGKGAGHLYGTSLPVGGSGTHSVITAHTGIGRARFFTDLTEMKEGDLFTVTVPGRKVTYRTDRILIVEPEDTSALQIEEGKDYCTLITCTPYGINSHRLLVRGERADDSVVKAAAAKEAEQVPVHSDWLMHYLQSLLAAGLVMTAAAGCILMRRRAKKV